LGTLIRFWRPVREILKFRINSIVSAYMSEFCAAAS